MANQVETRTATGSNMQISLRLWGAIAVMLAFITLTSGAVGFATATPPTAQGSAPTGGSAPFDATPLVSGLPLFPTNLTHFVYIVRENHVFDDYLGDCFSTINDTCNYGANHIATTNHIADVPFLHQYARQNTVFDNMYSSVDPYSAQAHAYLFAADVNGGSDSCSNTVQGTGSTTQWGIYNSSSVQAGSCSWSPDSGSQSYPSDGTIFDRFMGTNVPQSTTTLPFLSIGDIVWELSSPGCSGSTARSIPGSLPGNSVAVEYPTCTGSNGWWTNSTSGSVNPLPPITNPTTHIPQMLFACQYSCSGFGLTTMNDQYPAYAFDSYVKDYGLPTYTFIELFDDHPGPSCTSSSYDTCIQWNDQSMNLIVQAVENNTAWAKSTVIAISEDDTQNGQNGPDHLNNGRRFPFVLVAPPSVAKTGNPNPASCGITTGPCGNVVHQTFNTSNVLAVMERVELNVNPGIFSSSLTKMTFPMQQNDQLAEGNPLEPVWRCLDPRVPCNNGLPSTPVLTSTAITPSPVSTTPSGTVSLSASATDQNGNAITGATFAWALTPTSVGSLSSLTSQTPTFTAASTASNGNLCENATYGSTTIFACTPVYVTASTTLASSSVTPSTTSVNTASSVSLHGLATTSTGGNVYPPSATFTWSVSSTALGSLNTTSGTAVSFTAKTTTGWDTVCLNVTWNSVTKMGCSSVQITNAPPTLTSGTLNPVTIGVIAGGTQTFYAQGLDQYGSPMTSGNNYAWSLSPSTLGTLSSTSGPSNTTVFTAGTTVQTGTLTLTITNGPAQPVILTSSISVGSLSSPLTASFSQTSTGGASPLSVTFTGTVSGGKGPYTDVWNFGDGSTPLTQNGAAPSYTYTYTTVGGPYTPTLTVYDSASPSNTKQVSGQPITVTGASGGPLTPHATCTPLAGVVPLTVPCTGSASGGTAPYTLSWHWGDGSASSTGSSATHTYSAVGQYIVTLWVNDSAGVTQAEQLGVDVIAATGGGTNPMSVALTASPLSGPAPLAVNLAAAASGGTGPYTYTWAFGDNSATETGIQVSHTYQNTGSYTVTVNASDTAGHHAEAALTITVGSTSSQSQPSNGPFGLSMTDLLLLLVVVVLLVALIAVLVIRRHPKAPPPATEYQAEPMQPGYGGSAPPSYQAVPMAGPPGSAMNTGGAGSDARAPDPYGGRR